jgi:hypothetical protein
LSLNIAKLQFLPLVASHAWHNLVPFIASCAAVEITVSSSILADIVSLSDIEIDSANIASSSCCSVVRRTRSRHIWKLKDLTFVTRLTLNNLNAYLELLTRTLIVKSIVTTFAFVPITCLVTSVVSICNV